MIVAIKQSLPAPVLIDRGVESPSKKRKRDERFKDLEDSDEETEDANNIAEEINRYKNCKKIGDGTHYIPFFYVVIFWFETL